MMHSELVQAVQDLTCCEDVGLIGELATRNWPETKDFKPVQARLLADLVWKRLSPPKKEDRL